MLEARLSLSKQETGILLSEESDHTKRKIKSIVLGFLNQWSYELSRIITAVRSFIVHCQTIGIMPAPYSLDITSISQCQGEV